MQARCWPRSGHWHDGRGSRPAPRPGAVEPSPAARPAAAELGLTARELDVLGLVAEGRSNRQLAEALFISVKTAGVHVSRILSKLSVGSRGAAAAAAHRLGLDDARDHARQR